MIITFRSYHLGMIYSQIVSVEKCWKENGNKCIKCLFINPRRLRKGLEYTSYYAGIWRKMGNHLDDG